MAQTLKYRINSITSQSENYPAYNLINDDTHLGWQSEFTPAYPQQIQLQFFLPVRTKTLKLTFHQYKIPSRVEVFVRLTKKQNYRKLGYIIPNDNTQSNLQDKQIKTMYFQFPCNYFKLVFYQNYKNQMNLFDQVAIDSIVCTGEVMNLSQTRHLDLEEVQTSDDQYEEAQQMQSALKNRGAIHEQNNYNTGNRLENNSNTDEIFKMFSEVYGILEGQKLQAIQHQDFQRAAHLKNAINNFKQQQNDIKRLQIQKKKALQAEDFDLCHRLKNDIHRKKQEFAYRRQQFVSNQMSYMSQNSHSRIAQNRKQNQNHSLQKQKYYSSNNNNNVNNLNANAKTDKVKDFFGTPQRQRQTKPVKKNNSNPSNIVVQNNTKIDKIDHNDQIVPALQNKNNKKTLQELGAFPTVNPKNNKSQISVKKVKQKTEQQKSQLIQQFYGKANNYSSNPKNSNFLQDNERNLQNSRRSNNASQNYDLRTDRSEYQEEGDKDKQKNPHVQELDDQQYSNQPTQYTQESTFQLIEKFDLQPLDLKVRLKIQHYFQTVKEPYWQMICHKNWKAKQTALQTIIQHGQIINKQSYMCMLEFVSMAIGDNHTIIIQLCQKMLKKIIDSEIAFTLPHLPYFVQGIINWLLGLLQNTNTKIVQQAYSIFVNLGMINFLSLQTIILSIIKYKQTAKLDPKFILTKINLVISIIEKYADAVNYFKDIINWAVVYLDDPNNKVKSEAGYLMVIMVDQMGQDKVINMLKNKPNALQAFYNLLNASSIQSSKGESRIRGSLINQSSLMENKKHSKQKNYQNNSNANVNVSNPSQLSNNNNNKNYNNNSSNFAKNKSQLEKGPQSSQKNRNPWENPSKYHDRDSNYSVPKKSGSNNNSKVQEQQQNIQLQYSRQSSQIYTQQPQNYNDQSQRPLDEEFTQRDEEDRQNTIKVMTEQNQDFCDFCLIPLEGINVRNHLMKQCVVIVFCEECEARIFIRQMTQHLLTECEQRYKYQQCKKCGLAFPIQEINQHVGRGLCRLLRGQGWQRCQFCGQDIVQDDQKWIEHAHKCPMLPQKRDQFSSRKLTTQQSHK